MSARSDRHPSLRERRASIAPASAGSAEQGLDRLALPTATDLWVSAAAVRQQIGAWAYGALRESQRPDASAERRAVAVANAVAELGHRVPDARFGGAADGALPDREVVVHRDEIEELTGLAGEAAADALKLLLDCGVLEVATDASSQTPDALPLESPRKFARRVRLAGAVCQPAPAVARIQWAAVRARLAEGGVRTGGLPAPLAVLRELAWATGPVADPEMAPTVRCSARELEAATRFGRSTVSEALATLERARLIRVEARRGQTLRCGLAAAAFGLPDERMPDAQMSAAQMPAAPVPQTRAPDTRSSKLPFQAPRSVTTDERSVVAVSPPERSIAADVSREAEPLTGAESPTQGRNSETSRDQAHRPAPTGVVRLAEFAGTPIYAPAGTPITIECDAAGNWTCRVGPHLRLGPIASDQS